MSAFPSLPLFTDAFLADTGHLNAQETGAYLLLLMVAWRAPDCRLPDDDARLCRWARVDPRTWGRIKPKVMEFWRLADGHWTQKRLTKERDHVSKRADASRTNGKHGGRPKSLKNNGPDNLPGSAGDTQKNLPNPNPNPRQEETPSPAQERPPSQGRPISPDWEPSQADIDAAIAEGIPRDLVAREAAQFRDRALANGTRFFDVSAAWRAWCRSPFRPGGEHDTGIRRRRTPTPTHPRPGNPRAAVARKYAAALLGDHDDRAHDPRQPPAGLDAPEAGHAGRDLREPAEDDPRAWQPGGHLRLVGSR